jgi:preprotein translocase subunit YajC
MVVGKDPIMDNLWILAQTESGQAPSHVGSEPADTGAGSNTVAPGEPLRPTETQPQKPGSPLMSLLPLILIMVFMYLLLFRGPRRQQKQQRQMVQTLKKNDRVRTIGGIIGTVVEVRDDEVHLKIDEANNTKIWISASAIGKTLSEEKKE